MASTQLVWKNSAVIPDRPLVAGSEQSTKRDGRLRPCPCRVRNAPLQKQARSHKQPRITCLCNSHGNGKKPLHCTTFEPNNHGRKSTEKCSIYPMPSRSTDLMSMGLCPFQRMSRSPDEPSSPSLSPRCHDGNRTCLQEKRRMGNWRLSQHSRCECDRVGRKYYSSHSQRK